MSEVRRNWDKPGFDEERPMVTDLLKTETDAYYLRLIGEISAELLKCRETIEAQQKRIASLEGECEIAQKTLRLALSTMEMQEKRATGEFHISQPAAAHEWEAAKDHIRSILTA